MGERRVRRREKEQDKRKLRATISLPPSTAISQTINAHHRPLGPTYSLPARRALPRIPEEEEKSCLGSTSGSIGSCYTASWKGENSRRATEDPRTANKSPKRAPTHGDWENPYWSSSSPFSPSWLPSTK